jgi:hypothetical protein
MGWYQRQKREGGRKLGRHAAPRGRRLELLETRWAFSVDLVVGIAPDADFAVTSELIRVVEPPSDSGVLIGEDAFMPGPPPTIESVYDDQGRLTLETYEHDSDGDSVIDFRMVSEYQYGEGESPIWSRFTEDRGADGVIDYQSTSVTAFDLSGNVKESSGEVDIDGDGVIDQTYSSTYKYDANGWMTESQSSYDENGDGVTDGVWSSSMTYDDAGRLLSDLQTQDLNGDGVIDSSYRTTYQYGADGEMVLMTSEVDEDGDGVFELVTDSDPSIWTLGDVVRGEKGDMLDVIIEEVPVDDSLMYTTGVVGDDVKRTVDAVDDLGVVVTDVTPDDETIYYITGGLPDDVVDDPVRSSEPGEVEIVSVGGGTTLGDMNGDGVFSSEDLVLLFQSGQFEDGVAGNSDFTSGDFDGDGDFTTSDLVFAFQNGGYVSGANDALLFASLAAESSDRRMAPVTEDESAVDSLFAGDLLELGLIDEGAI